MKTEHSSKRLEGKKVLITGGTTGIGRATSVLLAEAGCKVFICGSDPTHLADALVDINGAGGNASGVTLDLSKTEATAKLFEAADERLGPVDIVILNAGLAISGKLTDATPEACREVVATNLLAYILGAREATKRMDGRGGTIVMIGSMSAHTFDEDAAVYTATKSGIGGFAKSFRKEANTRGIRVAYVEPGLVGTDMLDEPPEEQREKEAAREMLLAEDIARSVLFLLEQPDRCDVVSMEVRPHLQRI